MLTSLFEFFRHYPQIIIFFALAGGYFIGKINFWKFKLGSTAGVLIIAIILGQINIQIPPLLKTIFFALFIFCIGYKVGPQFFGSLKKNGLKYLILSLFVAIIGLVTAYFLGKIFGFDPGTTAGLLGGAMTQSSVIGTADEAIRHLTITAAQKTMYESNVAIAYAITYIFGTAGLILFFKFAPRLIGVNLKEEAKKLEKEMSGGNDDEERELFHWDKQPHVRAYRVTNKNIVGKTISNLHKLFSERVIVDKIKREHTLLIPKHHDIIQLNDLLEIVGFSEWFLDAEKIIGEEIGIKHIEEFVGEILDICVLSSDAAGKALQEIGKTHGHGCFLKKITRQGHELPITKKTIIHKCDILQVFGSEKAVERLVTYLGYPERPTATTDLIMVSIGCIFGTLLGLLAVPVANIPITLGIGGGVLVSGLLFGWLRSLHPTFGQIPSSAQWIFTDLGLNLFIACVGLTAGPRALHALQTTGFPLFLAGIAMTLTPTILGLFFGKIILKLNPILLLGALTGAGTITAALNVLKEEAESPTIALGYTIPYAFGNVLLTVWGSIIVYLIA